MTRNAALTQSRLAATTHGMQARAVDSVSVQAQAIGLIAAPARREAYVMAYADVF